MAARVISVELGEDVRTRRVVSRSNHRVTGKYPGFRSGRSHHWESFIERDAFQVLDSDPILPTFDEQPAIIHYHDGVAERRHYPDLLLRDHRIPLPEFVEIKSDEDAARPEIEDRTALMTELLPAHGYAYRVWKESEIRITPRLNNARYLLRHGRCSVPLERIERIRRLYDGAGALPWSVVTDRNMGIQALADACHLILAGRLCIDLNHLIEADTPVTFVDGGAQ